MKLAVISDIHDNLVNLRKCLAWCKNNEIEKIICCGDIANSETLGIFSQEFSGDIFIVRGNMEIYEPEELAAYKNYTYGGRTAVFEIGGKRIGVCHEPYFINKSPLSRGVDAPRGRGVLEKRTAENLDIIFYGHTHKPWIEEKKGVKIANPGTLGGVFARATFAVWDTAKSEPELKILDLL
jgi:uncharacterized protein